MPMSERAIRNWEVKMLRHLWQQCKLLGVEQGAQIAIDDAIEKRGAKREADRMMSIHLTMRRSGAVYDKV